MERLNLRKLAIKLVLAFVTVVDIKYSVAIRDNLLLKAATKLVHFTGQDIEATIAMASDIKVTTIVVPSYRKVTVVVPFHRIVMEVRCFHKVTEVVIVGEEVVDCKVVMLPIKLVGTQLLKDQNSSKEIQMLNSMEVITKVATGIISTAVVIHRVKMVISHRAKRVVVTHMVVKAIKVKIIVVP